jgi:hypothetical protein
MCSLSLSLSLSVSLGVIFSSELSAAALGKAVEEEKQKAAEKKPQPPPLSSGVFGDLLSSLIQARIHPQQLSFGFFVVLCLSHASFLGRGRSDQNE